MRMMRFDSYLPRAQRPMLSAIPDRLVFIADFSNMGDYFVQLVDTLIDYGITIEDFLDCLITHLAAEGAQGITTVAINTAEMISDDMLLDTVGSRLINQIHQIGAYLNELLSYYGIFSGDGERENVRLYERRGGYEFIFVADPDCEID